MNQGNLEGVTIKNELTFFDLSKRLRSDRLFLVQVGNVRYESLKIYRDRFLQDSTAEH
jgi:hypothetical protein